FLEEHILFGERLLELVLDASALEYFLYKKSIRFLKLGRPLPDALFKIILRLPERLLGHPERLGFAGIVYRRFKLLRHDFEKLQVVFRERALFKRMYVNASNCIVLELERHRNVACRAEVPRRLTETRVFVGVWYEPRPALYYSLPGGAARVGDPLYLVEEAPFVAALCLEHGV